jgi:hypothetical protein
MRIIFLFFFACSLVHQLVQRLHGPVRNMVRGAVRRWRGLLGTVE